MKLTIESTSKIVEVNGVECRVWEGCTESGIDVHCFVARVGVDKDEDCIEFELELVKQRAPSAAVEAIPARLLW